jgi:hypothetical protein
MIERFSWSSFGAGILLGGVVVAAWLLGLNSGLMPTIAPEQGAPSVGSITSSTSESGAVAVSNQASGMAVLVDSVTVPPPGVWVAVREIDGTDLGNVLGAMHVGGPRTNVTVPLLRGTEPNTQYAIELYRDDNNGTFDPTVNSVYVDFGTGARVVVYFKTTN